MNFVTGWIKGSWLWLAIIGALVVYLLGQQVQVSNAKARVSRAEAALSVEKLDRQAENTRRALAALAETQRLFALAAAHANRQQEAAHELAQKTLALAAADQRYAALDARVRNTAAALGAALDRADAEARKHAGQHSGDRPETVYGVLADGVRLVGEGGAVVRACRSDLARRDAEVAALKASLLNDRGLLDGLGAILPGTSPAKLPNWSAAATP